jgi:hypothetical protein
MEGSRSAEAANDHTASARKVGSLDGSVDGRFCPSDLFSSPNHTSAEHWSVLPGDVVMPAGTTDGGMDV